MPRTNSIIFYLIIGLALSRIVVAEPFNDDNLVVNGSFAHIGPNGYPAGWAVQSFSGNPMPTVTTVPGDDGTVGNMVSIKFNPPSTAGQALTFYRNLPVLDISRNARFSFKYKLSGTTSVGSPSYSISASQGNNEPSARMWLTPVFDGQWHAVSSDVTLQGLKSSGNVIEFAFNGLNDSDQTFYLADVKLEYLENTPPVKLTFKLPISGVLFIDDPRQTISGTINTWLKYSNNGVRIRVASQKTPGTTIKSKYLKIHSARASWDIDFHDFPVGTYYIYTDLLGSDGKVIFTARDIFSKVSPSADIPRIIKGTVYYRGKPFLPIGLMHVADWVLDHVNAESQRIGADTITRKDMLTSIKARGFNTIMGHSGDTPEFVKACLEEGLMILPTASPDGKLGDALRQHAIIHKNNTSMLGWYGVDEPILGERMNTALQTYKELKEYSPHRLVWSCAYMPYPVLALNYQGTMADAILIDRYEIRSTVSDLSTFGSHVRSIAQYTARNPGLLVGATPQVFIYQGPEPSAEQLRVQTYLGLVNGARAFIFYAYAEDFGTRFTDTKQQYPALPDGMSKNPKRTKWWLPDSDLWDAFAGLNKELRMLESFILTDGKLIGIKATTDKIQYMAKTAGGRSFLIAVNPTAQEQRMSFILPEKNKIKGVFGTPQVTSPARNVNLTFRAYEVKIFHLTSFPAGNRS